MNRARDAQDQRLMAHALGLARRGLSTCTPNPRVGCVIARDGQVLGEGWHARAGGPHAEVLALRAAGATARGATAYVTLAPCNHHGRTPPCSEALLAAGVARVVAAVADPNPAADGGLRRLAEAGVETATGVMAEAATALNCGFFKRARAGLPWVRLKIASSLDGRTAMASGESRWITGAAARQDVQRWRARSCCVLSGSGTVLADDPQLNVRLSAAELGIEGSVRQPLRSVLDSRLRTPPGAAIVTAPGHLVLFAGDTAEPGSYPDNVQVEQLAAGEGGLDLRRALTRLAGGFEVNEVHVEAGARLAGALLAQGLVDELLCYVAGDLLGSDARAMARLPIARMAQRQRWRFEEVRQIGDDLRLRLLPRHDAAG